MPALLAAGDSGEAEGSRRNSGARAACEVEALIAMTAALLSVTP
jgi:hypothetical protein